MKTSGKLDRREERGFSLAELVIVVMIVLVLAALAIPNLLRARDSANEAAAEGALRTITMGQVTYSTLYQGYAPSLLALGPPKPGMLPSAQAADLIDSQLASGFKCGYKFRYSTEDQNGDGIIDGYVVEANSLDGTNSLVITHSTSAHRKTLPDATGKMKGDAPD